MIDTSVISVGIDVGKSKLDVASLRDDRSVTHQVFSNNKKGITAVVRFLKKQKTATTVPCVLESTGDCHLLPALMLRDAGFSVKCINPIITKKYTAASIRGAKSDSIDCVMLARIGLNEPQLDSFADTRETIAAKKLISSLAQLETIRQKITAHFKQLRETSDSLGIRCSSREAHKALDHIEKQIELCRLQVATAAPTEAQTIAAMTPGVSHQQVAVLLVALGDKKFSDRDQLVAFVGLDVRARQSGQWVGKQSLSKRGNGYLRKILFQMGWGLIMNHPVYSEYYRSMKARGHHYKTCVLAAARKFLRFLFAFYWKKSVEVSQSLPQFGIQSGAFRPLDGRALAMAAR